MAGSGHKKLILNTREKWISSDFNRMQSFVAAHRADIIQFMLNVRTGNDEFAGTLVAAPSAAQGDPPIADIFEGLTVLPQSGKTSLHIVGGVIGMVDPDGVIDPDDSAYKLTVDPGIQSDGVLDISSNASGSIRIDVIECARTTLILATDNRDIFNPATGLFTPVNVDKTEQGRLMFRIREGTPGAGFPGSAPGWVPLCVASVPNGSTNTDDVTFWDVRPLIADRMNAPHAGGSLGFPKSFDELNFGTERDATNGAETRFMGHIWGHLFGRKIGGRISKGTPGGDFLYVDLQDSDNQEPGFVLTVAGELYYVWAVFPENLPRWVRYAEAAVGGQRIPTGFRGIIIASNTGPSQANMIPTSPLALPAITGLIATVSIQARCVAVGKADIIFDPGTLTAPGDGWMYFEPNALGTGKVPDVITASVDDYTLIAGTDFPANARAVKVRIEYDVLTAGAGNDFGYFNSVNVLDTAGSSQISAIAQGAEIQYVTTTVAQESISQVFEVPRLPPFGDPTGFVPSNIRVRHTHAVFGSFISKSGETITVIGWRIE